MFPIHKELITWWASCPHVMGVSPDGSDMSTELSKRPRPPPPPPRGGDIDIIGDDICMTIDIRLCSGLLILLLADTRDIASTLVSEYVGWNRLLKNWMELAMFHKKLQKHSQPWPLSIIASFVFTFYHRSRTHVNDSSFLWTVPPLNSNGVLLHLTKEPR